jgi:hypothetical protein
MDDIQVETDSYQKLMGKTGSIRGFPAAGVGWTLGRVSWNELVINEPYVWTALTATGTAGSGIVEQQISDAAGKDMLYHENPGEVWEVFMGWTYPHDQVYFMYNSTIFGQAYKDAGDRSLTTTAASKFGYLLKGWESLYNQETGRGRFLLPAYQHIKLGVFNPSGKAHTLQTRFLYNKLKYEPFNPNDDESLRIMVKVLRGQYTKGVWLYSPGMAGVPLQVKTIEQLFGVEPLQWNGVRASTKTKALCAPEDQGGD